MGGAGTVDEGYRRFYGTGDKRMRPLTVVMGMTHAPGAQISIDHGLQGPLLTFSSACASSAQAIGEALRAIRGGLIDAVVAGGSEALLTPGALHAWAALRALAVPDQVSASRSCKPFAADRTGLVLGEGAAAMVLESEESARARGATILAELVGYGGSADASHISAPDSTGQARAMRRALDDAGVEACEVGYINAHGTGTLAGDASETEAIKAVFGEHARSVPVSSTKSMHGHLMGAAGALELIVVILALRHRALPPTAHLDVCDPLCDLDYIPNVARYEVDVRVAMSSSFAFGGANAVLVARRYH
jgi:3-oxoacyl-[acyl-carrier-protein] synthase II